MQRGRARLPTRNWLAQRRGRSTPNAHVFVSGGNRRASNLVPSYEDPLFIAPGLMFDVLNPALNVVSALQASAATLVRSCSSVAKRLVIGFRYSDRYCSAKFEEEDNQIP